MQKFFKISIIIFALLLMFSMVSCVDGQTPVEVVDTVVGIEVDSSTIPAYAVAGKLDLSTIKLKVHWTNNTTTIIDLDNDMISINDRYKLDNPGQQQITVFYEGNTTKFQIDFEPAPLQKYNLIVEGGELVAINDITLKPDEKPTLVNGRFTADYDEGTKLTIRWILVPGYEFRQWNDFDMPQVLGATTADITMNKNHHYKAITQALVSVVNFITNDATVATIAPKRTNILYESDINNGNVLMREGYVFDGWTTKAVGDGDEINCGETKITFPYSVEIATTLYATWRPLGLKYRPDSGGYVVTKYELDLTQMLEIPQRLEIPRQNDGLDVLGIDANAFVSYESTMLQYIHIPDTINTIEDGAFRYLTQLKSISSSSQNFELDNGVLYSGGKERLIAYPSAKIGVNYSILEATTEIAPYAFKDALLGGITLNKNIEKIGEFAFDSVHIDRINLDAVVINGNTVFADDLFNSNLKRILVSPSYLSLFQTSTSFNTAQQKITTDFGEFSSVEIAIHNGELLYRTIMTENSPNQRMAVEIIGAKRDLLSVTIPLTIRNRYVFSVSEKAFNYCSSLNNVIIPLDSNLERVGEDAFSDTPWLEVKKENDCLIVNDILYKYLGTSATFELPTKISKIAEGAFYGNKHLTTLDMNTNSKLTFIGAYAFYNCESLTGNIEIMSNVETIFNYAFANTLIDKVDLQEGSKLKTIGEKAFANCYYLKSAQIGGDTSFIAPNAFLYDYSLEEFSIQPIIDTRYFNVHNGILYRCNESGVENELFLYPAGKLMGEFNFNKPSEDTTLNISTVGDYGLFFSNIAALIIPESINNISANAIYIPGLIYTEFEEPISNITYKLMFQDDPLGIGKYEPEYVVFNIIDKETNIPNENEEINISNFYAHNTELRDRLNNYNSSHTDLIYDETSQLLYAYDSGRLSVAKSSRTLTEFTIPSNYTVLENQIVIKYIDEYAFFGNYVSKVTTGSGILEIENYAFYWAQNLAVLDMKQNSLIATIAPNTFNSFFNNGLLIYIVADATQDYIDRWTDNTNLNITYKYLLEAGEGIANYVTLSNEEWNTISYFENGNWKTINADNHTEYNIVNANCHPIPARKGYIFKGWYDENGKLIDAEADYTIPYNINLTARWEAEVYTIIFKVGNGVTMPTQQITISYDAPFEYDTPLYPNKKFIHWRDSTGKIYGPDSDETVGVWKTYLNDSTLFLYPVWQDVEFLIVYDSQSLEGVTYDSTPISVKVGYNYSLAIPEKTGYVFLGWTLSSIQEEGIPALITDENGESLDFWSLDDAVQYTVYPYFIPESKITVTLMITNEIQYDVVTDVVFGQSFVFEYLAEKINDGAILSQYPIALFCGWVDSSGTKFTDDSGKGLYTWNLVSDTTLYALWPEQINSQEEFDAFLVSEDYLSKSIALNVDVTLTDPIGDRNNHYTGVFIGNGHQVNFNYTVESIESNNYDGYVGMIAYNKGTIKNVKLIANINIVTTSSYSSDLYLGGIAGINEGRILSTSQESVSDIVVSIFVNFTQYANKYAYIGGLVGKNSGTINNLSCEINTITINYGEANYTGDINNIIAGSIVGNVADGIVGTRSAKYYYNEGAYILRNFGTIAGDAETSVNVTKTMIN